MGKMITTIMAAVVGIFMFSVPAQSQTMAIQNDMLVWTQDAVDLAEANVMGAKLYVDGSTTGIAVSKACSGTVSPFTCQTQLRDLTNGPRTLRLTATRLLDDGRLAESPFSETLNIIWVAPPQPGSLRIVPTAQTIVTQPPGD